jgi:predicted ABC-type ATPase
MPNLYIIAGPNGAGKTTASYTILPQLLHCKTFVNADEIARGLSPLDPEKVSFEAGKIMLQQLKKNLESKLDFAIETTLSTKYYFQLLNEVKAGGYEVTLVFFWLKSIKIAKERVKRRVKEGGHNIPPEIIKRRYSRGLKNFKTFAEAVDKWILIDNGRSQPYIVAEKQIKRSVKIYDHDTYNKIIGYEEK